MNLSHFFLLCLILVLVGCGPKSVPAPSPEAKLSPQEKIAKIQSDPNIPDGLKRIQIDTLQRQAGPKL